MGLNKIPTIIFTTDIYRKPVKAEVLRKYYEMMDEAKDEGTTPGRSNAGRPNGR